MLSIEIDKSSKGLSILLFLTHFSLLPLHIYASNKTRQREKENHILSYHKYFIAQSIQRQIFPHEY